MGVWVWREASTNSYPYQTNTVSIGPSHHGTRTIVQPCWPLSLTPVSSSTWQMVWSMFLAYQKARLSAFNVVTYKEDKIINFINFILWVADRCSRKSLAHPLRRSFFFFLKRDRCPLACQASKEEKTRRGSCQGARRVWKYSEVKEVQMLSSEKPVPREPMCTVTERERKTWDGSTAFSSGCVVCSHNRLIHYY